MFFSGSCRLHPATRMPPDTTGCSPSAAVHVTGWPGRPESCAVNTKGVSCWYVPSRRSTATSRLCAASRALCCAATRVLIGRAAVPGAVSLPDGDTTMLSGPGVVSAAATPVFASTAGRMTSIAASCRDPRRIGFIDCTPSRLTGEQVWGGPSVRGSSMAIPRAHTARLTPQIAWRRSPSRVGGGSAIRVSADGPRVDPGQVGRVLRGRCVILRDHAQARAARTGVRARGGCPPVARRHRLHLRFIQGDAEARRVAEDDAAVADFLVDSHAQGVGEVLDLRGEEVRDGARGWREYRRVPDGTYWEVVSMREMG